MGGPSAKATHGRAKKPRRVLCDALRVGESCGENNFAGSIAIDLEMIIIMVRFAIVRPVFFDNGEKTMTNVTITLPEFLSVTRAGATAKIAVTKLSPVILADLLIHGFGQKVGDAAAGSGDEAKWIEGETTQTEAAQRLMNAVVDALEAGDWTKRRVGGAGEPAWMPMLLDILREEVRDNATHKKAYKACDSAEKRREYLIEYLSTFNDAKHANYVATAQDEYQAKLDAEAARKARLAKRLATEVTI